MTESSESGWLRTAGASASAIRAHYDLSDEFFALWLGDDMVYSCALWEPGDPPDALAAAQRRKLDWFASRLVDAGDRVLDVGCGWGGFLDRCVRAHGAAGGVGLTLSPAQSRYAQQRGTPGVQFLAQSWVDHEPDAPYDAVTCIESTEHFASDALDEDEKVEVYRAFFARAAEWLKPDGRIGLQLICLDNAGHETSRRDHGPFSELIVRDIFPESMAASLSELALGWETSFRLDELVVHADHYRKTFRAWATAFRGRRDVAEALVGPEPTRTFERYFAAGEVAFRLREHALYRAVLTRRPQPKVWAVSLRPSELPSATPSPPASADAVRSHYDVSNDFYALWLGPTMMYSSGMWEGASPDPAGLDAAEHRKIDYFAQRVLPETPGRVLDVGCGWGGALRRLAERHGAVGVGLTLSPAQRDFAAARPVDGVDVRLESWEAHEADARYDALMSFGAFEHFARDGSDARERVLAYRRFFERCFGWLAPGGRLGLETIAHDDAPDTAARLGRGPLGDSVLEIFPESICPHLNELVLGFEPYFALDELRSDADDFARTCRAWLAALRARSAEAEAIVGHETCRRFERYLASSELQFRVQTVTNYRVVLHRRPAVRR
jgi:cyclopropane-fatty-acyl-phospholipid synthase